MPYPKRNKWTPVHSTTSNVSHFIYRDVNRNGLYDVGDRPMVDVAVSLTRPDGSQTMRRSNIHGFVNFTNSLTAAPVDVRVPGEYVLKVLVPNGWLLTSNNVVQTLIYRSVPDSRPGIVSDAVPVPAGLAQVLSISGRIALRTGELAGDSAHLTATCSTGLQRQVVADIDGQFSVDVEPGICTIEASTKGGQRTKQRSFRVDQVPVRVSTLFLDEAVADPKVQQQLIDFESITYSPITKMPNGPAGLAWNSLIPVQNEMYKGAGYINNTISGHYVAYNTSGYPVTITRDDGFDFYGGYFGVAWRAAEGETLQVRAWRGDAIVGAEEYELSALGPFWFDADYRAITRLDLSTKHFWQFVTDDLTFGITP